MRLLVLVALIACKGSETTKPPTVAPVARDARDAVADAGAALRTHALPVAKIDGAFYYPIADHVDADISKVDPRTWATVPAKDELGVRPATKPAAPWSLVVGTQLAGYTIDGVSCPARVTGIALLDRLSAEAPQVLGRLEASGCAPAIVGGSGPPKRFAFAAVDARDPELKKMNVGQLTGYAEYDEHAQRLKRSAIRDHAWYVVRSTPPIGVMVQYVAEQKECGVSQWTAYGAFELGDPPTQLETSLDTTDFPIAAYDTDGDGRPELLFGEGEAWDRGQTGGKRYAALHAIGSGSTGDVGLSYYIGCD
jgi:hypothetical protein